MKKIDEIQKTIECEFEKRRRELFTKMTHDELEFLADYEPPDPENSLTIQNIFKRVGGLWHLKYISEK